MKKCCEVAKKIQNGQPFILLNHHAITMKRTCLSLLLALCCVIGVRAQIIGGQIDYNCLGNGRYEVLVRMELPCGQIPTTPLIRALAGPDTLTADSLLLLNITDISAIAPGCPTQGVCQVDANVTRTKQYLYRGIIDLDTASACLLRFFIRETTVASTPILSGRNFFYIETLVNRCLAPCDRSAEQISSVSGYVHQNQDAALSFTVFDPLHPSDSFGYEFDTVRENRNQVVTYTSNFGPLRWITFFGFPNHKLQWPAGMNILQNTGVVLLRPTQINQKGVMVLKVTTYRKIGGVMTAVAVKHIEKTIQTVSYLNNVPKLLPPYAKHMCVGSRACVSVTTDDDDPNDSLFVEFGDTRFPGLEITQTGFGKHPTYQVCFTADSSMLSHSPVIFPVTVRDNACPIGGTSTKALYFHVREKPKATTHISVGACGEVTLDYSLHKQLQGGIVKTWTLRDSLNQIVLQSEEQTNHLRLPGGRYFAELTIRSSTPCDTTYYDTIQVAPSDYPFIATTSTLMGGCIGDTVTIGSLSQDTGLLYLWNNGSASALRTTFLQPDTPLLALKSSYGVCARSDTFYLQADSLPQPNFSFTHHWRDSSTLQCFLSSPQPGIVYLWTFRDSLSKIGINPFATGLPFEPTEVKIRAINRHCSLTDSTIVQPSLTGLPGLKEQLRLYPNPFHTHIFAEVEAVLDIRLFNSLGQTIPIQVEKQGDVWRITPITGTAPGVYWLRIQTENGTRVEKLVRE